MNILAIESSCDETAVAVVRDGREILSNVVLSQVDMHAIYGGVVPEIASRKHIEVISKLTSEAIKNAGISKTEIDAVGVTFAPGLIGALLVGVNFAKAVAYSLDVPLIPVHHMRGHIAANYLTDEPMEPPFLCLVVSGGHSLLVDVQDYTTMKIIGSTRDDAAGECFDKIARTLGLGYPGGKVLQELAVGGDDKKYKLPHSKIAEAELDMSFSGLKTAVINLIHNANQKGEELDKSSLAASFQATVSDILVSRAIKATKLLGYQKLAVAGGVSANARVRADIIKAAEKEGFKLSMPPVSLCGDNGAMIGCQAYYEYLQGNIAGMDLNAKATLGIDKSC